MSRTITQEELTQIVRSDASHLAEMTRRVVLCSWGRDPIVVVDGTAEVWSPSTRRRACVVSEMWPQVIEALTSDAGSVQLPLDDGILMLRMISSGRFLLAEITTPRNVGMVNVELGRLARVLKDVDTISILAS